jgi:hypothetical protein
VLPAMVAVTQCECRATKGAIRLQYINPITPCKTLQKVDRLPLVLAITVPTFPGGHYQSFLLPLMHTMYRRQVDT